jgi:SAM-dependent methyltransferase
MTSEHETETNLESESPPYGEQPARTEKAYERLTAYGFARRYVKGKVVADVGGGREGYGPRLLAETAGPVTAVNGLHEVVELDSALYDVVVAFGVIEDLQRPEDLVKEARRTLKEGGVLLISATDKHANTIERNRRDTDGRGEMYVPEFRRMLEGHFEHVQIYRQGAVAGGFVYPASEEPTGTPVEVARFSSSLADHDFGVEPPTTRSVIAVCSDGAGVLANEPYLLLDGERLVFEESEERAEDVELLRAEIRRIQETEVQAFIDAIKVRQALIQELPRYLPHMRHILLDHLIHRRNVIRGNIYAIKRKGAIGLARGAFRRSSALYRRLQARTRGSD